MPTHRYSVHVRWTGNLGEGTRSYRAYNRNYEITAQGKPAILGSSDPAFRGDPTRYNPEELLVAALSTCHMLWVLHLAADRGIVITTYTDDPHGVMIEHADGSGEFESVTLRPRITVTESSRGAELAQLHDRAHECCFVARSVKFPVRYVGTVEVASVI